MGQSQVRNYVHLVFSTRNRAPLIRKELRKKLFGYIYSIIEKSNCKPLCINGVADHVHILFGLGQTMALCDLVMLVKTSSSRWVKSQSADLACFAWQHGYGAYSVSPTNLCKVRRYIDNQEQHHRNSTAEQELAWFDSLDMPI
ncbi:MAG: IS200/IS605 family transposase [Candidatus Delongbacteria bacterium]|nr:IS200/IS605 family transposase [Anaerolineae bacterium]MCB9474330.1 IS200/IS605 family transposase [Candidatus Delongbacteria bacterium]